ncbi:MAG: LOG family protein [Deltaproteobacteria bacterium]|nr:LOG family protein [Deltaproteobacteria bacterium]
MDPRHKRKIGVMGSASGPTARDPDGQQLALELGRQIARAGCILINGACPGLPDRAAEGAKREGGFVFGVSPAFSLEEHVQVYASPIEHYDMILYSGMGLMERDIVNIRSADAVVIVGGGVGTLNEFTVAYEERKPVGVLTGTGGISDHLDEILQFAHRKAGPDRVIYDGDPARLVERLLALVERSKPPMRESEVGGVAETMQGSEALQAAHHAQRRARDADKQRSAEEESGGGEPE